MGSVIRLGTGLFSCCCTWAENRQRQRFLGIDFLPTGKHVLKAGMLPWNALDPRVGGNHACWGTEPLQPAVPPCQAHQHDLLPFSGDHHVATCWHSTWTPMPGPAVQTTPRLRSPSVCLSWPRDPHDFSVILKTSSWLSSVSCWKNVKATRQLG